MRILSTTRQRVGAAAVAVAVAGGAGAVALGSGAFASASTPQPAATAAAATAHHPKAKKHGLLARSDYAQVQVKRHGRWVTYVLDRGKVTAVGATRLTIVRPDGVTVSLALSPSTKYKGVSGESKIKIGEHASVISAGGSALRVSQRQHPKAASATAALTSVSSR